MKLILSEPIQYRIPLPFDKMRRMTGRNTEALIGLKSLKW